MVHDKFHLFFDGARKIFLRVLVAIIFICSIFAFFHFIVMIVEKIKEPPVMQLTSEELFEIFSFSLVIVIAFELMDVLLLAVASEGIPTMQILQIGIVALATKIITSDIKHANFYLNLGLAIFLLIFSVSYVIIQYIHRKKEGDEHKEEHTNGQGTHVQTHYAGTDM